MRPSIALIVSVGFLWFLKTGRANRIYSALTT